ncbi:MAG TPA: YqeG family HAD IIIA-type phosphatase [bacterium]|nr:YqeG family HAD IIIA-type phosphatase [bacterium]
MLRWLRPASQVPTVYDIDLRALRAQGIRGVILDLDNTIVPWGAHRPSPELPGWIAAARAADLRLCIVSNNMGSRVTKLAMMLGLPVVTGALKPWTKALRRALSVMETTPEVTALVGDQVLTDILGGNRLGLHTILVRPQGRREFVLTRLMRFVERAITGGRR